jgi:hypothetical protein
METGAMSSLPAPISTTSSTHSLPLFRNTVSTASILTLRATEPHQGQLPMQSLNSKLHLAQSFSSSRQSVSLSTKEQPSRVQTPPTSTGTTLCLSFRWRTTLLTSTSPRHTTTGTRSPQDRLLIYRMSISTGET